MMFSSFDSEIKKVNAKYVFLDVVGYTSLTIENQAKVVTSLQQIVKDATNQWHATVFSFVEPDYLPTGDGMCVVYTNDETDDVHIKVSLKILELVEGSNKNKKEKKVPFMVRIGVNENKDIQYRDINDRDNYAGRGINLAQRCMGFAGPGQIVVGSLVYEKLIDTENYRGKFKEHSVTIRHGQKIMIYQFVDESLKYLNSQPLQGLGADG